MKQKNSKIILMKIEIKYKKISKIQTNITHNFDILWYNLKKCKKKGRNTLKWKKNDGIQKKQQIKPKYGHKKLLRNKTMIKQIQQNKDNMIQLLKNI